MEVNKSKNIILVLVSIIVILVISFFFAYLYLIPACKTKEVVVQTPPVTNEEIPEVEKPVEKLIAKKTYKSSFEKLSFTYLVTWKSVKPTFTSPIEKADSFKLVSPSGDLYLTWVSAIDGIGGACVPTEKDSCPIYTLQSLQKIGSSGLYYVEFIYTLNKKDYFSIAAIQDKKGQLKDSKDQLVYLFFEGKHNGGFPADLSIQTTLKKQTKAQAIALFSTPEFLDAKNILLSASY